MRSWDGAVMIVLAFHQCGPGSNPGPGLISGLSLLLVHSLLRGFFSGYTPVFLRPYASHGAKRTDDSGFPLSTDTNTSKFQFELETVDEQPLRGMCHCKFLYIYYYLFICNLGKH